MAASSCWSTPSRFKSTEGAPSKPLEQKSRSDHHWPRLAHCPTPGTNHRSQEKGLADELRLLTSWGLSP